MKIYLLCILFQICGIIEANAGFRITGKLNGINVGKKVYLQVNGDTLAVAKSKAGIFKMRGKTDIPRLAYLNFEGNTTKNPLFLENTNFTVDISPESVNIKGGVYQEYWNCFQKEMKVLLIQKDSLREELTYAYKDPNIAPSLILRAAIHNLDTLIDVTENRFIKGNNNIVSAYIVQSRLLELLNRKTLFKKYELLGDSARKSEIGRALYPFYENRNQKAVGMIAPDFTLQTPEGTSLSLYSIKSKAKIIDFWASWCGPCRAANPHIVSLYNKYKDKGLEILGISLDSKIEPWKLAIEKDKLIWNHVSDLKGWECPVASLYGVKAVPYVIVLDQDNRIVGDFLRGEELDKCLEKLFK